MLTSEHVRTQSTLVREHVSTQGTLAREHVSTQGKLHISTEGTLVREHVFITQGTQFSKLSSGQALTFPLSKFLMQLLA